LEAGVGSGWHAGGWSPVRRNGKTL
jgi:hypothetical protein